MGNGQGIHPFARWRGAYAFFVSLSPCETGREVCLFFGWFSNGSRGGALSLLRKDKHE
jgi:hypothetical protein